MNEALVLSPLIPFVFGTPFVLQFRMVVGTGVVNGPADDFKATSDLLNNVTVTELNVFDENEDMVTDASIMGAGGTEYPGSVHEPGAVLRLALA